MEELLNQLKSQEKFKIRLKGEEVEFNNLDKIYYPKNKITKREVILHYAKIAHLMLPHLEDRPVTLNRFPEGVEKEGFFQRNVDETNLPKFVKTVDVYVEEKNGISTFPLVNNLESLVLFAQWGTLEFHPWYSKVSGPHGKNFTNKSALLKSNLNYPDYLVFDLDPYIYDGETKGNKELDLNRNSYIKTVEAAKALKKELDSLGMLKQQYKLSGKTGIHCFCPISGKTYEETRALAQEIGEQLSKKYSDLMTTEWRKNKRKGKVFFDANQNSRGKTLASVYSLRITDDATVSFPVKFSDLDRVHPTDYTIKNIFSKIHPDI
ncbi:MAG: hypothetical protein M1371_03835 [Actinobacteria bacterium]|nr:hypothetical protein [Actinomycetota bacterium]